MARAGRCTSVSDKATSVTVDELRRSTSTAARQSATGATSDDHGGGASSPPSTPESCARPSCAQPQLVKSHEPGTGGAAPIEPLNATSGEEYTAAADSGGQQACADCGTSQQQLSQLREQLCRVQASRDEESHAWTLCRERLEAELVRARAQHSGVGDACAAGDGCVGHADTAGDERRRAIQGGKALPVLSGRDSGSDTVADRASHASGDGDSDSEGELDSSGSSSDSDSEWDSSGNDSDAGTPSAADLAHENAFLRALIDQQHDQIAGSARAEVAVHALELKCHHLKVTKSIQASRLAKLEARLQAGVPAAAASTDEVKVDGEEQHAATLVQQLREQVGALQEDLSQQCARWVASGRTTAHALPPLRERSSMALADLEARLAGAVRDHQRDCRVYEATTNDLRTVLAAKSQQCAAFEGTAHALRDDVAAAMRRAADSDEAQARLSAQLELVQQERDRLLQECESRVDAQTAAKLHAEVEDKRTAYGVVARERDDAVAASVELRAQLEQATALCEELRSQVKASGEAVAAAKSEEVASRARHAAYVEDTATTHAVELARLGSELTQQTERTLQVAWSATPRVYHLTRFATPTHSPHYCSQWSACKRKTRRHKPSVTGATCGTWGSAIAKSRANSAGAVMM